MRQFSRVLLAAVAVCTIASFAQAGYVLEVDTDDEAGRAAFREDWEQRREELTQLSYRLRLGLIPISTNEDVHRSLVSGLRQYAGRR